MIQQFRIEHDGCSELCLACDLVFEFGLQERDGVKLSEGVADAVRQHAFIC